MSREPNDFERLSKISAALDDSILDASEKDLREEISELGGDFDHAVARARSSIERAKVTAAKATFERAKIEAKAHREGGSRSLDLAKARERLRQSRLGAMDTMIAARKGGKLSDSDEDGLVDDLAQLQALDDETREGEE